MIRINLALRKQAVGATSDTGLSAFGMNTGRTGMGMLKELPIRRITLPVLVGFAANFWLEGYKEEELSKLGTVLEQVKAESSKIEREFNQYKNLEQLKKSMDDDELAIKTKLETIKVLVSDRSATFDRLVTLSRAIPSDVWLSELSLNKGDLGLKGSSVDFNQVSDFMKKLKATPDLANLELLDTQQKTSSIGDVVNFEIKSKALETGK